MITPHTLFQTAGVALLALNVSCASAADHGESELLQQAQALFKPLPSDFATKEFSISPERVTLGHALFFDPRISVDGTVSCGRCHQPTLYGTDALPVSIGNQNRVNPRNAPTVLNAAGDFVAHWRGDRVNVEDQATKALVGPPSFGQPNFATAMAKIEAISGYPPMFQKAFPNEKNPINQDNWGKAIGAYERTLVTPSPFDAYLKGDMHAISPVAQAGLKKFIAMGCVACHSGVGVGGGMYQKFGVYEDYWKATGSKNIDKGRFDVTHSTADMYVFKVPSLRNVTMTAPYFHDGSVASLPDAVRIMGEVQLSKKLAPQDVTEIVAFLATLTGILPDNFKALEVLPPGPFLTAKP